MEFYNLKEEELKPKWILHINKDIKINFYHEDIPNWFHRKMVKVLLGWRYEKNRED